MSERALFFYLGKCDAISTLLDFHPHGCLPEAEMRAVAYPAFGVCVARPGTCPDEHGRLRWRAYMRGGEGELRDM